MKVVNLECYFHLFQPNGRAANFFPLANRFDFPHASSFQLVDQLQIIYQAVHRKTRIDELFSGKHKTIYMDRSTI
jgi:hypothetical protein